jgi:hypothetical protein
MPQCITSREASRKHGIDRLPWKVNNDVIPPPSKKTKTANLTTSVTHEAIHDGTIRARTDAADDII